MVLVAGVDSSTQSCKVVVREAGTGRLVRSGHAPHPAGTSVDPAAWQRALDTAVTQAGGLGDVSAISVAAQQHGMVCLDEDGRVVRDALLWNDTRSAQAAADLVAELPGGAAQWAAETGSVPVASFTVTKLRWLAEHEPANAAKTAAVCLPHDWLSWQLRGSADLSALATDRGDASGTGYWCPSLGEYRLDLLQLAFGGTPAVPVVLGPTAPAGVTASGVTVGPGTGDNAAAALGVGAQAGDMIISIGTSGVVSAVNSVPVADPSGLVAGFADASGHFLPLACTLNGVGVLHAAARMLGVSVDALSDLALSAKPGAGGLVFVPYLEGERTPNRPNATGALHGLTASNATSSNLARAAVEGLLCGLADCLDVIRGAGVPQERLLLVGGGARSEAIRQLAPTVLCAAVHVLEPAEYVADGAALQAAWVLSASAVPPAWPHARITTYDAPSRPDLRDRYAAVRELTSER